jgi:hypothetical protein
MTYVDRFFSFVGVTNPLLMLASDADILDARKSQAEGKASANERNLVGSSFNESTNEMIPVPFRVSAIVAVNIPLVTSMILTPASNVPLTLGLHWANQSYNAGCNYYNRSGGSLSNEEMIKSYGLAVVSALGIAHGLGKAVARSAPSLVKNPWLIPFLATSAANSANLASTRAGELTKGCAVLDSQGNEHGTSVIAGRDGIAKCALSRGCLVPGSVLILPPIIVQAMDRARILPKSKPGLLAVQVAAVTLCLQVALPAALAIFPTVTEFPVASLEPRFQNLKDKGGNLITTLYATKGL